MSVGEHIVVLRHQVFAGQAEIGVFGVVAHLSSLDCDGIRVEHYLCG